MRSGLVFCVPVFVSVVLMLSTVRVPVLVRTVLACAGAGLATGVLLGTLLR